MYLWTVAVVAVVAVVVVVVVVVQVVDAAVACLTQSQLDISTREVRPR